MQSLFLHQQSISQRFTKPRYEQQAFEISTQIAQMTKFSHVKLPSWFLSLSSIVGTISRAKVPAVAFFSDQQSLTPSLDIRNCLGSPLSESIRKYILVPLTAVFKPRPPGKSAIATSLICLAEVVQRHLSIKKYLFSDILLLCHMKIPLSEL